MTRRRNPEPTVEVYRDRHGDIADVTVRLAGGSVSAIRSRFDKPDVMHVGWSELPESARGKGLGVQMYAALMDWALANNITLTSDEALSPAAGRVWEALAKRGYPIQKHPTARLYTEDDRSAWGADDRNKPFTLKRRNPSSSLPRLLRLVPEEEVVATWAALYAEGKHKGHDVPDLERHLGKSPVWAEVAIPHNLYNADWNTEAAPPEELLSEDQLARSRRYAARATKLPPGMAAFTGRAKTLRAYVSDGNHRAFAAYLRGEPTARFFMPLPDYERFVARLGQSPSRVNPRPTTAERTDPALWEAVKREVTAGSKGGVRGEWSARKAQLAVALYKQRGGDYLGPKSPRNGLGNENALAKWTREDWRTRSGEPSLVTGERYLPARAIAALTDAEYAATTRAKRAGMRKGQQFVPQPERIREKTARYRKNPDPPDTAAFRRWFGASKVVDAEGKPLVVYHGTVDADFDTFKADRGVGVFFTADYEAAQLYAGSWDAGEWTGDGGDHRVYRVYLRILRPLVVDAKGASYGEIVYRTLPARLRETIGTPRYGHDRVEIEDIARAAPRLGYDGVIVRNVVDDAGQEPGGLWWRENPTLTSVYVVFDSTQIKSANMNVGTFAPADPRITHNPRRRNPSPREAEAMRALRANLTPDLLAGEYRACAGQHPMAGHCSVATEALYFMLGGKTAGYTPMNVRHEGVSHWYLRTPDGRYLDPTADQFDTPVDYASGRGRGFPTPKQGHAEPPPSKRAAVLLRRIGRV